MLTAHGQSVALMRRHGVSKGQGTIHVSREELKGGFNYAARGTETTHRQTDKYNRSIDNRWSPAVPKKVSRDLLTPPDPASNPT